MFFLWPGGVYLASNRTSCSGNCRVHTLLLSRTTIIVTSNTVRVCPCWSPLLVFSSRANNTLFFYFYWSAAKPCPTDTAYRITQYGTHAVRRFSSNVVCTAVLYQCVYVVYHTVEARILSCFQGKEYRQLHGGKPIQLYRYCSSSSSGRPLQ